MFWISLAYLLLEVVLAYFLRASVFERGNRSSAIVPIARTLLSDGVFGTSPGNPTASNEPLYSFFLAVTFFIFGKNWLGLVVMQSLVHIAGALILKRLAGLFFPEKGVSFLAFLLVLFYPFYITQAITVADTTVFTTLLAFSAYLTFRVASGSRNGSGMAAVAGIVFGLLLLTRQSILSIIPFAVLYILINPFHRKRSLLKAAILVATCIMTVLPWIARNYSYTQKVFISTHGGIELWFAFNPETRWYLENDVSVDGMRKQVPGVFPELADTGSTAFRNSLEAERHEFEVFSAKGIDYIRTAPGKCISMIPLKFIKFWSVVKNPSSHPVEDTKNLVGPWDLLYTFYYTPLLVLGLTGMFLALKRKRPWLLLFFYLTGFTIFHSIVYGFTRLRVPLDQFLILYASFVLTEFISSIKKRFAS